MVMTADSGFTFMDLYNLPVHIRNTYYELMVDRIQKINEAIEKAKKGKS